MKTESLYQTRLNRILKAVALETPDRTPVVLEYSGFAAYVTGTRMAEFLRCPETNLDTMIKAFEMVGESCKGKGLSSTEEASRQDPGKVTRSDRLVLD